MARNQKPIAAHKSGTAGVVGAHAIDIDDDDLMINGSFLSPIEHGSHGNELPGPRA